MKPSGLGCEPYASTITESYRVARRVADDNVWRISRIDGLAQLFEQIDLALINGTTNTRCCQRMLPIARGCSQIKPLGRSKTMRG